MKLNSNGERIISEGGLTSGHDGDKTTDDKFFGTYNEGGIKSIQLVANGKASLQIDHLQYGR